MTVWDILSSYPSNIYTILVGVLVVYWLFVIIGAADIDMFSIDSDLDLDIDIDMDADVNIPGFVGLMQSLGLLGIPFSIVLSVLLFTAWVVTYYMSSFLFTIISPGILTYVIGTFVMVLNFFLAVPVTVIAVKPLRKIFVEQHARTNKDVIGSLCRVTSLEVSRTFGQGFAETGGAGMNVRIRADEPNEFTKGSMVRIIDYNEEDNSYEVMSEEEFKLRTI